MTEVHWHHATGRLKDITTQIIRAHEKHYACTKDVDDITNCTQTFTFTTCGEFETSVSGLDALVSYKENYILDF